MKKPLTRGKLRSLVIKTILNGTSIYNVLRDKYGSDAEIEVHEMSNMVQVRIRVQMGSVVSGPYYVTIKISEE